MPRGTHLYQEERSDRNVLVPRKGKNIIDRNIYRSKIK